MWRIGADENAERVSVSVGVRQADRVEIEADLQPGDRIVTAGTHKVRAGAKVTPVAAATAAPAPAVSEPPKVQPGPSGAGPGGGSDLRGGA